MYFNISNPILGLFGLIAIGMSTSFLTIEYNFSINSNRYIYKFLKKWSR